MPRQKSMSVYRAQSSLVLVYTGDSTWQSCDRSISHCTLTEQSGTLPLLYSGALVEGTLLDLTGVDDVSVQGSLVLFYSLVLWYRGLCLTGVDVSVHCTGQQPSTQRPCCCVLLLSADAAAAVADAVAVTCFVLLMLLCTFWVQCAAHAQLYQLCATTVRQTQVVEQTEERKDRHYSPCTAKLVLVLVLPCTTKLTGF